MPTRMQRGAKSGAANTRQGGAAYTEQSEPFGVERNMQRMPQNKSVPGMSERRDNGSPLLNMARRIREEQGVDGLSEFIVAMTPFAAPFELKSVAGGFGLDYDAIIEKRARGKSFGARTPQTERASAGAAGFGMNSAGFNQTNGNPFGAYAGAQGFAGANQLMQLMRLMPMLQSMLRGGTDISQLMKMMGG